MNDIEEFGDLPQYLLDRLSQILSKRRIINSRTVELLLQPDIEKIAIYDCGRSSRYPYVAIHLLTQKKTGLEQEDFQKIFAFLPHIVDVNLRFAGQLKNDALMYMIDKNSKIKHLQLGATNLISDDTWRVLLKVTGPQLESLKLSELNDSFYDESIQEMAQHCRQLRRLKLRQCSRMTHAALASIASMTTLEHVTLAVGQDASSETLVALVQSLGPSLKTLCLENYAEIDDAVLEAIHNSCKQLSKLRLTGSTACSDRAFADLFTNWGNPALPYFDLSNNRDIDNGNPESPADSPVGFGSEGVKALMKHSGSRIERLNIHSDRHISHEALSEVFDGQAQYAFLKDIDMSFVTVVDDFVMAGVFKSCPQLAKLAVFACFKARDARIPAGVAVIGLPNAQDTVVMEGNVVGEL